MLFYMDLLSPFVCCKWTIGKNCIKFKKGFNLRQNVCTFQFWEITFKINFDIGKIKKKLLFFVFKACVFLSLNLIQKRQNLRTLTQFVSSSPTAIYRYFTPHGISFLLIFCHDSDHFYAPNHFADPTFSFVLCTYLYFLKNFPFFIVVFFTHFADIIKFWNNFFLLLLKS